MIASRRSPSHVEFYGLARGLFYFDGKTIEAELIDESGKTHDCGSWESLDQVLEYVRLLADECNTEKDESPSVLHEFVAKRAVIVVAYCHADSRWSVLAGMKQGWVDTRLRYDSWEEANKVVSEVQ